MTTLIPKVDLKNGGSTPTGAINRPINEKIQEIVSVKDFGAIGNGSTDDTVAIQAAITAVASTGQGLYVPAGTYKITSALSSTGSLNMFGNGTTSIFDFSSATIATPCLTIAGSITQIQNITSASQGNLSVAFASAPSLSVADVFCISSSDLWNTARAYYYAGEWCQARSISGTTVGITNPLYDSYTPANVKVYKLNSVSVSLRNMQFKGGANTFGLVTIQFCDKPKLENITAYNENYQAIMFDRCYRPTSTNCTFYNKGSSSDDYGLLIGNCQKVRVIGGDYYARRHGISIGGGDYPCAVTNRDVRVIGSTISNDINSGVYSADMHGNMQDCYYQDCTIYQGGGWAGADNGYDNCTIYSALGGWCIYSSEVKGGDLYVRNSKIYTTGDPSSISRGIIDVGGNNSAISSFTNQTLNIIVENCYITGPATSSNTDIVVFASAGSSAYTNIKIDGLTGNVNACYSILRTRLDSGTAYCQAIVVDNVTNFPTGAYLHYPQSGAYANFPQRMMRQSGILSLTATSGTSQTVSSGTYYRYPYPRVPNVQCSIGDGTNGFRNSANENVGATVYAVTSTYVRPALVSTSNANWTQSGVFTANWFVGLEEV
jgi:hypothetical protein